MMMKRFLALVLTFATVLSMCPVQIYAAETDDDTVLSSGTLGSNLTWSLDNAGQLTISGTGAIDDQWWGGAPWYSFADSITTVIVEEGVTSIGQYAFMGLTSLNSISLPGSLESIGAYAFYNCGLSELTIPKNVYSLGMMMLYDTKLNNIYVDPDNPYFCSDGEILYNKDQSTLYYVVTSYSGELTIPSTVTEIGQFAMYGCSGITAVTLPDGLLSIGLQAFESTSISTVSIPASVSFIDDYAFASCGNLKTIVVDGDNACFSSDINGALYDKAATTLICLPNGYTGAYVMPDSVTAMSTKAFSQIYGLSSVTLSGNLKAISQQAFAYCFALTEITIPSSVTEIGIGAFSGCSGLSKITFQGNAPTIDTTYFETLFNSLTATAYYPANNETWTDTVMQSFGGSITWTVYEDSTEDSGTEDTSNVAEGTFGDDLTWALDTNYILKISGNEAMPDNENGAAPWNAYSDRITAIEIGDGITYLGEYAFAHCSAATSLTIGSGVTRIGSYAIFCCTGLTSVTIPETVKTIDDGAFYGCIGIKEMIISNGVESIGSAVFQGCDALTSVTVPASVTSIAEKAFTGCEALQSILVDTGNNRYSNDASGVLYNKDQTNLLQAPGAITGHQIPEGVTSIGNYAYSGCNKLTQVSIPASVTSIGDYVFSNCQKLSAITVQAENTVYSSDPSGVLYNKEQTELLLAPGAIVEYTIPDGVLKVCTEAFYGCRNLTNVTVSDTVEILGYSAFNDCDSLKTVTIGSGVSCLEKYVFRSCENLTEVRFTGNAPTFGADVFSGVTATVYYPANNDTWENTVNEKYGGTITWTNSCFGNHTASQAVIENQNSAGCETQGSYDSVVYCAVCGTEVSRDPVIVKPNGHTYSTSVTSPTCMGQGYTTYTCGGCGTSYVADYMDANGHSYGSWYTTSKAGCTATGVQRRDCANCEHYETQEIPANGHSYSTSLTAPTCLNQGYTTYACGGCGASYVGNHMNANGHSYGSWYTVTAAGCTTTGQQRRDCANCTHYETQPIAANGHNYSASVTASTCLEQGYTTYTCGGCGASYVGNHMNANGHSYGSWYTVTAAGCTTTGQQRRDCANCTQYETQAIAANGHSYSAAVIAPTCLEQGFTMYTCSGCGGSYAGDYVNANGHSYGGWYTAVATGCTTEGELRRNCINCAHYETQSIPVNGHSYSAVVIAPTCVEMGYTKHTCAGCGDSYGTDYTNIINHSYSNGACVCGKLDTISISVKVDSQSGKPVLSWSGMDVAVGYRIYRAEGASYTLIDTTGSAGYTDTSAVAGTTYQYKVVAVAESETNNSPESNIVSAFTKLTKPVITVSAVASSGKLKISWPESEGAAKYYIYRKASGESSYTKIKTTSSTSYTDKSTKVGTKYYYKVKAVHSNTSANSGSSAVVSSTCTLPRTKLSVSVVTSTGKIKLSWDKVSGASKYYIYRKSSEESSYTRIKTSTSTSYTDTNAEPGVKYSYKVKAVHSKSAANSASSSVVSCTCDLPCPNISVSLNGSGKPKIKWAKVEGAVKYCVYRKASGEDSYTKIKTTTSKSFTDKSAKKGVKYYYKVKAICSNSEGNSASSKVVSIKAK